MKFLSPGKLANRFVLNPFYYNGNSITIFCFNYKAFQYLKDVHFQSLLKVHLKNAFEGVRCSFSQSDPIYFENLREHAPISYPLEDASEI